ncbi:DUF6944 family repetitive protein [Evansella cellulosilytica]|uniref:Uncharacterized protein n=1 Tax=Evansella cellulosilytica (strain ATCC 21833 / DSM 2522 / FERM P-1141 / JCM 9156 / N-4) TaxID=649639 RepID=E6TXE2_EVAC2|nr:hypothetical protein [Evansella cellulosilytica]ADU32337.1 hypothetical protein Bcell_4109 [Evansella cellulosilytica DSM 2522]
MPDARVVAGNWIDAVGTIISAIAEVRELANVNEMNDLLVTIGEGLQAIGGSIASLTATDDDELGFSGSWIDNAGAATSSIAAYLQHIDEENGDDNILLESLGDGLQSLGSFMSAISDYEAGEDTYALGNAIQGIGAGLESIAGIYELRELEVAGQPIGTIGAILQAIGQNLNAVTVTREVLGQD